MGIALVTIGGCSTSSPTSPASGGRGSVAFRLDKATIPQGVTMVEAVLSRSGYDSLATSVDVRTDTSAMLQMSGIPVGQWHLTVNALGAVGNVLYTGDTDVNITAGATTQLNLTLQPVSQGTGSISITVNWGTGGPVFVDYANNPVLKPSDTPSPNGAVAAPRVLYDNGEYDMWYMEMYGSGVTDIWNARSTDGTTWQTTGYSPVLQPSTDSTWDSYAVGLGTVMKQAGLYYMYYTGMAGIYPGSEESTGLATSSDRLSWTKHGAPVFPATGGNYSKVIINSVLKYNGEYYAYYDNHPLSGTYEGINLATSTDGVHWDNYSANPILSASLPWEGGGIGGASVVRDSSEFVMVYYNELGNKIGMATSEDGIHWIKMTDYVFSSAQTTGGQFNTKYPCLVYLGNNEYRLYYTSSTSDGSDVICLAEYNGSIP